MAQEVCVVVGDGERARLVAIAADRNHAQKHVQRARIILLSAERLAVAEVARQAGVSRPAVWRWQARYAQAGVDGLLRDKTRPPVPIETMAQVLALTCSRPPGQATHWTGRAMAKATGISLRSVQRIWDTHRLQPHRLRTFKHANDPAFAEKMEDIVGLYMDPPMHTVVLSIDEKSQIQALDRTQPGLPLKPGKCGTRTHDYKRNGVTTLFAALNVQDGTVLGRCLPQHRHQEYVRFLNAVERAVPAGKLIHAIADNYGTLAGAAPALDIPFHPNLGLLDQRRGGLLLGVDPKAPATRNRPVRRGSRKGHRPLHPRAQCRFQAVRVDHASRQHPRQAQPPPCTF
jgi:transposase